MKTLNLSQLIEKNDNGELLSYEEIAPYKSMLYKYYKDMFCCEPVFMLTFVTNAIQAGKIVSEEEFMEAIEQEIEDEEDEEIKQYEREVIPAQSFMLKDLF